MAWHRKGAKPLPELVMAYWQLSSCEQISIKPKRPVITIYKIFWAILQSLDLGVCGSNSKNVICEHMLPINSMSTSCEIATRWMPQNTFDDMSTLNKAMASCRQATGLQAITWANVNPDIYRHMRSLGPNELIWSWISIFIRYCVGFILNKTTSMTRNSTDMYNYGSA